MANPFDGDKRYTEIVFEPGKWDSAISDTGRVTWTTKAGQTPDVTITKIDGTTQAHNDCQPGSSITTINGTAVVHVV